VKRRSFITLIGGAAAAWPIAVQAQQPERVRRIGVLMPFTAGDAEAQTRNAVFAQSLGQLGWTVGETCRSTIAFPVARSTVFANTRRNWLHSRRT
jgi:putative tryptophan/tyrosine transport system substrate-binding protein